MNSPFPLVQVSVGLVGDYDSSVTAHRAIPLALQLGSELLRIIVNFEWVPTDEITSTSRISRFDGIWCIPASPYRNMAGALAAIQHAREQSVPFLGTCGGFQHAVVEFARNVLSWADAEHAEYSPQADRAVIAPLECMLLEKSGVVRLLPGTRVAAAYGVELAREGYHCRYGFNPVFLAALTSGPLRVSAVDEAGDVRAIELEGHPFFVATLFQPERAALKQQIAPLVVSFLTACAS